MTSTSPAQGRMLTYSVARRSSPGPLDDPHVGHGSIVNFKAKHGSDFVKTGDACCPRVQMQSAPALHFLHKENVAVAADEQGGPALGQFRKDSLGILGGSAANVRHPNRGTSSLEMKVFGPLLSNLLPIDVAKNSTTRGNLPQRICHCQISNVPCMPDFIAAFHVVKHPFVHVSMGVRKQRNVHAVQMFVRKNPQFQTF